MLESIVSLLEALTLWPSMCSIDSQGPKKAGKKGGGKKKSAKVKAPTIVDGISTEEMTKEQVK